MKVGMIRHYKVRHHFPFLCNSAQYDNQYLLYEDAEISLDADPVDTREYTLCFSSDSKRAIETAENLRQNRFETDPLLREVQLKSLFQTKLKLPFFIWYFMDRTAWFFNRKGHPETRFETRKRASDFLNDVVKKYPDQQILIVSHGFFMLSLRRQLLKMGFDGDKIIPARNGKLYRFERN